MEVGNILQIINTAGFPIAMCVALLWYINKIQSDHKEESYEFAKALNANTLVMQKLCDRLDSEIGVDNNES